MIVAALPASWRAPGGNVCSSSSYGRADSVGGLACSCLGNMEGSVQYSVTTGLDRPEDGAGYK